MEFVEPEGEPEPFRSPLPPDDRLWRHPSELSGAGSPPPPPPSPPPPSPRPLAPVIGATALVAGLVSAGLVLVAVSLLDRSGAGSRPVETRVVRPVVGVGSSVVDIAERVRPAIARVRTGDGRGGDGSAVLFRSDGHLLTNAHLVEGAGTIDVVLADGRQLPARLVGTDSDTDAAVVKIEGDSFPIADLGTSRHLKPGQQAIVLGSQAAGSAGSSVTVGVISAVHRAVRTAGGQRTMPDMLVTDAPIPAESSGGALLDDRGTVVGIATVVPDLQGGWQSMGLATPIDVALAVARQLIATGKVTSTWLGIRGDDVDGGGDGVVVAGVQPGSPAERAGVEEDDVIVEVDGGKVSSMGELVTALRRRSPGDPVRLSVSRDGRHHSLEAVLAERPPDR